jgi:hypothetical protein
MAAWLATGWKLEAAGWLAWLAWLLAGQLDRLPHQ